MRPVLELITTGSELLSGRTASAHARTLGEAVLPLGLSLARDTTVPDEVEAIADALRGALARVEVVVLSGGLGPTSDDLTREVVASHFGRGLLMHEPSREAIRQRYARTGRKLNESVERHALVIEGAEVWSNPAGLAPGELIEEAGRAVLLLPGPPREFLAILQTHVLPWLQTRFRGATAPLIQLFEVCGLGESDVVSRLVPKGFPGERVDVAYCAMPGRVEIRLSAPPSECAAVERASALVRESLGHHVFAEERLEMEVVVGRLLSERNATLATAESCTGGLIGHRITNVPGSSKYYLGGVVAYANESKARDLNVSEDTLRQHGAVSRAAVEEMALGVRRRFGSDYALAVTGVAGPSGGTPEKPVGLVYVGVADAQRTWARELRLSGDRALIKEWSSQMALDFLRRRLLGAPDA